MTRHGGITRAAHTSVTRRRAARPAATPCTAAQRGCAGSNGHDRTAYPGVGSDARTSRADPSTGHRTTAATDGFQASADVTELVRKSGAGARTVAQINVARGYSPRADARGGRTLVAAYRNSKQPLHGIALRDGFQSLGTHRRSFSVRLNGLRIPAHSHGRAGAVAYDGDRGRGNVALSVRAGRHRARKADDSAGPADDVMNSAITESGRPAKRCPACRNTLAFDSAVFDIGPALRSGGDRLAFRFTTRNPGYLLGALFGRTDTRH
ncbi:hypothetical protein [Streptomyces decoyicus]|uniref:hypothetical protein n=1 Tax=Streptomyces decoyicus TaxID=249567 RepID=UPI001FD7CB3F|nr:hypothetical protein [Streptomyces decoyicus]